MKSSPTQEFSRVSFLQLFRLFFVVFSLYLLREVFGRWDGFSFYANFSEFIPAAALVSIFWTIVSFIITVLLWILFGIFEWLFDLIGLRIKTEHFLFYGAVSSVLGSLVWKVKKLMWPFAQTSTQLKIIVLICVVLISLYVIWALRNKVEIWFKSILEKITPLVWIFSILVILSIPLVAFQTIGKESEKPVPKTFAKSNVSNPDKKRPNILLVVFDTLTARDMSLHGYHRETTPFITEWAKDAAFFKKAEAENSHTTPTTASLMTGKRVWTHQVFQQRGKPVGTDTESLPKLLKDNGYYNVAFIVNYTASTVKLGLEDSFDISPLAMEFYRADNRVFFDPYQLGVLGDKLYRMFGDKIRLYDWILDTRLLGRLQPLISPRHKIFNPEYTKTAVPPEIAFNKFLEIVDDLPEPYFAWIQVFPPHAHYLPPEPYRGMFGPQFSSERYKSFTADIDSQDMHDMRILYDEFIRYCDEQYKDFMTELDKRDKSKNTVVILSSDHGESFQHGVFQHKHPELYEQQTHIPLVIKEPGQSKGIVIDDLVEQIDIPASILDLAHIPVPGWMEGRSFVPLMRGEKLPPRPAFSMYLEKNRSLGHQITKGTIAVWEGDYKLIHYLKDEQSLLFNLKSDPEEMSDLMAVKPEVGKRLLDLVKKNLEKANNRIRNQ